MKNKLLIILLSIFSLSCNSNDDNSEMTNVEFTLIAKDNLYGNGGEGIVEQNMVISSQTAWNELIAQMNSVNNVSDNFTETDVNFSEYTVIAVFDEIKSSSGHSLELNIMSNSENIIVDITDITPNGNALTVITQPFIIVKIENSQLPVIFK